MNASARYPKNWVTTLWVYKGSGDPYANPLSDVDWSRLAKVKDLTPGELTAESYDDSYLDDEDADWTATGQGQKSAGDTSFTLAWMPGEQGQQALLAWFNEGDTRAYKIRFPNGTVDVFRGWVSSIGKAVTAKEVITRTVKVTNVGRPSMAEDRSTVTAATGMTVTPASTSVVNEWFSAYAMAGVAYSRVSTFSGDYLRVTDNKGKTHDVLTGSDDGRHSNTSLAWGAGVQFNPTESVAIDIAYEGSGSGDWRTNSFIVGVGYKF
ncbi:Ail/Lom family outer membrane beta-barrel protein [Escherichia coli]|uniref:Ail/Lom family outer membrane beta-barrel protein n=24 Tax=Escherichia TaxID=561 RepID=UPI003D9C84D0